MAVQFDFTPYFERYEQLVARVDQVFESMSRQFPTEVSCTPGCCDCCFALFDLSFIEALYINHRFNRIHQGRRRALIIEKANRADREAYRVKREAFKAQQAGAEDARILESVAGQRVRCPLLNEQDRCDLYDFRPITCRLYGIPTAFEGRGHCCGLSGFEPGRSYPTVKMDAIYRDLHALSAELVADLKSRYLQMADMLIPVSMALLTDFDETYLGLPEAETAPAQEETDERVQQKRDRKAEKSHIRQHVAEAAKISAKKGI